MLTKMVINYWKMMFPDMQIDPAVLSRIIDTFGPDIAKPIFSSDAETQMAAMVKIIYRYNDVIAGTTIIKEDGTIVVSSMSYLSELDIKFSTLQECIAAGVINLKQLVNNDYISISEEAKEDLTTALVKFIDTNGLEVLVKCS